jgi:signal peptidase I
VEKNDIENTIIEEPEVDEASQTESTTEETTKKGFLRDLLETIAMALVLFVLLNAITSRVKVYNVSMQPTLKEGYLLLVNKLAYKLGSPKLGDIIVFHYQGDKQEDYIKRVIGLPGDRVEIQGGVVRVNGKPLTEPYILELPTYTGAWQVPEGELFVLGDNRNHSSDSHQWGMVKAEWVVGKALLVYWPLEKISLLTVPNLVHANP